MSKSTLSKEGRKRIFSDGYSRLHYSKIIRLLKNDKIEARKKRVLLSQIHTMVNCMSITDNDDKFTLSSYTLKLKSTRTSNFMQCTVNEYLTLNKKTNKLYSSGNSISFRTFLVSILSDLTVRDAMKGHRFEWLLSIKKFSEISDLFSQRIIRSILIGKITNTETLYRKILSERGVKNVQLKPLMNGEVDLRKFIASCKMSDNPNRDYEKIFDYHLKRGKFTDARNMHYMSDLMKMAFNVGAFVNFSWSPARIKSEHDKLVREVEMIKVEGLTVIPVDYKVTCPDTKECKILKTNIEFLLEASCMSHCLYSSDYFNQTMNKNIFIVSYDGEHGRGTAEISVCNWTSRGNPLKIKQFYGYKNQQLSSDAWNSLIDYLNSETVREWIINEFSLDINFPKITSEHNKGLLVGEEPIMLEIF